jgi:hypothetical protein
MTWELHLTVNGAPEALRAVAAAVGGRVLSLALAPAERGPWDREEMLTCRVPAEREAAGTRVEAIQAEALRAGLRLVRTKVEAGVDDAVPALYLEHHVKVRLAQHELEMLRGIAERYRARVSRQPRRAWGGGEERYLTARFERHDAAGEAASLQALLRDLALSSLGVAKIERERIVFDQVHP